VAIWLISLSILKKTGAGVYIGNLCNSMAISLLIFIAACLNLWPALLAPFLCCDNKADLSSFLAEIARAKSPLLFDWPQEYKKASMLC